jgi:hypothetical protein
MSYLSISLAFLSFNKVIKKVIMLSSYGWLPPYGQGLHRPNSTGSEVAAPEPDGTSLIQIPVCTLSAVPTPFLSSHMYVVSFTTLLRSEPYYFYFTLSKHSIF